jgi:hypothetical protein
LKSVKNGEGKTVCKIDPKEKIVEILYKGSKTKIRFLSDDSAEISNIRHRKTKI